MKKIFALGMVLFAASAFAQTYPARPVKLVVPFPAGSATDQIARVMGQQFQEALGQPFVVENKPGAQGSIAATEVARAAPDGYTIMVTTNTPQAANVSLFKKLNYDPVKDFAPIARLGTISFMIMVRPDFPAKNFKEFLAHAKANPGKLSAGYGSAGSQVSQAMLRSMGGIDFVDVPYKGLPQAITDVLGGSIHFTFADLANALAQIKGGKLRGLAVTSQKRSPLAPDVPAVAEELAGYELIAWFALVAPANTPAPVLTRLHDVTVKSLAKPEVKARFDSLGTDVAPMNPQELGGFIRSEIEKWAKVAKAAGIQPE
ncbi:MAG TPA: tripartite tricarboxylate transporter substrate binding protein [Burkholderiales bacterium]|nr:tripartite tricarboxylate transporter substrate binding protein [Burkholderiales bacterium]